MTDRFLVPRPFCKLPENERERKREREIALVRSAGLAYEDGSVFMSMAHGTGYGTTVIKSITWTNMKAPTRQHDNHGENQGGLWL